MWRVKVAICSNRQDNSDTCSTQINAKQMMMNPLKPASNSKRPYSHTPILNTSLKECNAAASLSTTGVCWRCLLALNRYKDIFQELTLHGSKLKRCKNVNPHTKLPEQAHYRHLVLNSAA